MKYENTPYKLKKIWTQSGKNKYEIVRQEGVDNRIKDSIKSSDYLVFKQITELSTEWAQMTFPGFVDTTNSEWTNTTPEDTWKKSCRYQWDIDFNQFPIKRIPFIKYNVVYKSNDSEIITIEGSASIPALGSGNLDGENREGDFIREDWIYLTYPRTSCIFRLEDVLDSGGGVIEDIKKVTMIVGVLLRFQPYTNLDKTYDLQAKLHISIYNPELAI